MTESDELAAHRSEEFVHLWSAHRAPLYSFIFSMLPDHLEAEEVFQRVSVVLWSKFDDFQPGTNFWRWAARVAQLEVQDYRKRKKRERLQFWTEDVIDSIADAYLQHSELLQRQRQALGLCIEKLASRDRELVALRYGAEQVTTKHLAEQLGRPLVTLYKALSRIRRNLYECIQRTLASE
ncbi:MAG: sigma-70 family RNA polymerase sigma factor [Pirellulales bacterium]